MLIVLTLDFDLVGSSSAGSTGDVHVGLSAEVFFCDGVDSVHRTSLEMWIWAVCEDTDMLLKFFDFGLIHSYLSLLRLSVLNHSLKILVKNFILISLCFDIRFKLFVIFSHLNMNFIVYNFSFFHQNVHHNIDFLSNVVSFLFEELEHIVAGYKFVLKHIKMNMQIRFQLTSNCLICLFTETDTSSILPENTCDPTWL